MKVLSRVIKVPNKNQSYNIEKRVLDRWIEASDITFSIFYKEDDEHLLKDKWKVITLLIERNLCGKSFVSGNHNILGAKVEYSSGKIPYNRNKELSYGDNKEFYVVPVKSSIRNTNGFIDLVYFIGESDLGHQFKGGKADNSAQRFMIEKIIDNGEGRYINTEFFEFSFLDFLSGNKIFSLRKEMTSEDTQILKNIVISEILYQPKRSALLLDNGNILIGSFA